MAELLADPADVVLAAGASARTSQVAGERRGAFRRKRHCCGAISWPVHRHVRIH